MVFISDSRGIGLRSFRHVPRLISSLILAVLRFRIYGVGFWVQGLGFHTKKIRTLSSSGSNLLLLLISDYPNT